MNQSSLEALIENNEFLIETATAVNQQNPTIAGYGNEPYVIGAAFSLNENQTSNLLEGNSVYKIFLLKRTRLLILVIIKILVYQLEIQKTEYTRICI